MVKGEMFSACCVKNRAAEAQDTVLTAGDVPKIFLAGSKMAVLGRLAACYPIPEAKPTHVLLNSATERQ